MNKSKTHQEAEENPLFKLDVVLMYLYLNDSHMKTLDDIHQGVFEQIGSDDNEIALILKKLTKDEYVLVHPLQMNDTGKIPTKDFYVNKFNITFDGKIFLKQGGYNLASLEIAAENKRLENIENEQRANQTLTTHLTELIAIATVVAAIYYGIQIYKEFHLFAHHHGQYWRWEKIPSLKKK